MSLDNSLATENLIKEYRNTHQSMQDLRIALRSYYLSLNLTQEVKMLENASFGEVYRAARVAVRILTPNYNKEKANESGTNNG